MGIDREKLGIVFVVVFTLLGVLSDEAKNLVVPDDSSWEYFNSKKPGITPEVFAPHVVSKQDRYEFGCVFSKNGKEAFYSIDIDGKSETLYSQYADNVWSEPITILQDDQYGFNDPMLSPDEQKLYFISTMPNVGEDTNQDYDIWYVERQVQGWSTPINAGDEINSSSNEYYISFTADGSMYFASNINAEESKDYNFDIYKSSFVDNQFQEPVLLSDSINTSRYEADVFIAPDESYIIFCAKRRGGYGNGDLYISFKGENGEWTKSKSMGDKINTEGHELCPFVTADGKYFIYTSRQDIYWVSTEIFSQFR